MVEVQARFCIESQHSNVDRTKSGALKPNTNFLRHIIRQTDSHNSALLAREAEESNARLGRMNQERIRAQKNDDIRKERKADGRLTPVLSDEESTHSRFYQRRTDARQRTGKPEHERRRSDRSVDPRDARRRSRSRSNAREKRKRRHSDERPSRQSRHSERERNGNQRRKHRSDSDSEENQSHAKHKSSHRHKRRRSRSRSSSRSRSRSSHTDRASRRRRQRDRSRSPRGQHIISETRRTYARTKRHSPSRASDSDPLEAIVGPLPPDIEATIRSRGRGAYKANSMGMDSRFSSAYDPSVDVRQASDVEDNWGDATESFRDRQHFKQQGADRLRAAGFTDEQVRKWEKGDTKDEADVTWTKRGQAREWDRGKVVDEDGHVELKPDWGRLK